MFNSTLLMIATACSAVGVPRVTALELRRAMLADEAMVIVDVRMPGDYMKGHIQGALNYPQGEVGTPAWGKGVRTVVYCAEDPCPLTEKAVGMLRSFGHEDIVVLGGGFTDWVAKGYPTEKGAGKAAKARPGRLDVKAVGERIRKGDLDVLDVRPAAEYAAGHVKGARNVPLEGFAVDAPGLAKARDVLVYDRTAARSRQAAEKLLEAGYKVFEMPGGLAGWVKKGNTLEVN